MTSYEALAGHYDAFTRDVPYEKWFLYALRQFRRHRCAPELIADLACGTGTMTSLFSLAGYDVIGVDASVDMLSAAADKPYGERRPVFVCQRIERLRLNSGVDAAVCFLDSINHITGERRLRAAFSRVYEHLNAGGLFLFDIAAPDALASLDGLCFTRESDDAFCTYQADFHTRSRLLHYTVEVFEREGNLYRRISGEHDERAWQTSELNVMLSDAGFSKVGWYGECSMKPPKDGQARLFCAARRI